MDRKQVVFDYLNRLGLAYEYYEHPETPNHRCWRKRYWKRGRFETLVRTCSVGNHKGNLPLFGRFRLRTESGNP